jgi:hypothetical protein
MKTIRTLVKSKDQKISDHVRCLWENIPLTRLEYQGERVCDEILPTELADRILKNQEKVLNGETCSHPSIQHNGMGKARCDTCGKWATQSPNGSWSGLK